MSSYVKQLYVDDCLLKGEYFPKMLLAIHKELEQSKWSMYSWYKDAMDTNNFSILTHIFGILLIYQGNDYFTLSLDGTYYSAFLLKFFECCAPYMNDGKLLLQVENKSIELLFKAGSMSIS